MTRILASSRIAGDAIDPAEKASPNGIEDSVLMMVPHLDTIRVRR